MKKLNCFFLFYFSREALAREREAGPDWGKLKKGKPIPKPGDPGWQYQLKTF